MRLTRLVVRRMPGIDDEFILGPAELGAGVTVIHGPNGVGKSSLCRAAHALLWPGTFDAPALSVEARFEDGEHAWLARRDGKHVEWQRDGVPSGPPELCDEHLARCFLITLEDLYDADRDGRWFAERVMREMAGGYDLGAVRREQFEPGLQHGRSEERALDAARNLVRQREQEQERVLAEERELCALQRELEQARSAASELGALEAAAERIEARARLAAAQSAVDQLPPATARVAGDEDRRLAELQERSEGLRARLRQIDKEEGSARTAWARAALERALTGEELDEQRERLDELRERERELAAARQALAQAEEKLERVRARLGAEVDLDRLSAVGQLDLDAFQRLVGDGQKLAQERGALESELRVVGAAQGERQDADTLVSAVRALNGWLRTAEPVAHRPSPWGWVAVALGAVMAIVVGVSLHPAGFALLLAPVLMSLALLRVRPLEDPRAAFVQEFDRTRLTPPAAWTKGAVEARVEELERERARLRTLEEAAGRRRRAELELERVAERERALEGRRAALRSTIGVETGGSDLALATMAKDLSDLRTLDAERHAAAIGVETHERERARLHGLLAAFVGARGEEPGEDATALARALSALERRSNMAREAETTLARCATSRQERHEELEGYEAARRKLFTDLDLEVGDHSGLARLLEGRAERQEDERALGAERALEARLAARLAGRADLAALDEAQVKSRHAFAAAENERLEELSARVADIRRGVRDARERSDLEQARAAEELARVRLEEAFANAAMAEAGRLLIEEVAREHERLSRPAVLRRASELFAAFTGQRYELQVYETAGVPTLRAIDRTQDGLGLGPDQLSGGTRAQLLLAVRLALAGEAERGMRLPIFVDDALSTSDPDRVRAIAQCLFALSGAEGRQVIALTKDEGDVALIRSQAQGAELRVVDLAALRRISAAQTRRERLELPSALPVPTPDGRDGPQYARVLGVPALDPWRPFGEAHLYHLLPDDLELLHRLLTSSIERVGPLRALLDAGITLSLTETQRAGLRASIELAQETYESWHVGRGRPLTREDLRICPAISEIFQERVGELAEELAWDARALVDALRAQQVKRFHGSKADEAELWLQERGHIAPEEPLSRDAVWARLLRRHDALAAATRPPPEVLRRRFEYLWRRFEELARP